MECVMDPKALQHNGLIHLNSTYRLWRVNCMLSTGGVLISNGLACWTLPHEIPTPSVVDVTRGGSRICKKGGRDPKGGGRMADITPK